MALLERLLRRSFYSYKPFSQKSIQLGKYVRAPWYRYADSSLAGRDAFVITNSFLTSRAVLQKPLLHRKPEINTGIEDLRRWLPYPKATNVYGQQVVPTDLTQTPPPYNPFERMKKYEEKLKAHPWRISDKAQTQVEVGGWEFGFRNPDLTWICLKRKMRKEIMHALGLSGKRNMKHPTYNQWSKVKCF